MQSLKVRGPYGSLDFQTLLVLGPLQKLLLSFMFRGSVPLKVKVMGLNPGYLLKSFLLYFKIGEKNFF